MKVNDMTTFKVINRALNDYGKVYTARIVERYNNGLKLQKGDEVAVVMFTDIQIID